MIKFNDWQRKKIANLVFQELKKFVENGKPLSFKKRIELDKEILQEILGDFLDILRRDGCYNLYCQYLDFSNIIFDGYDVTYINFENSNVKINPQKVKGQIIIWNKCQRIKL